MTRKSWALALAVALGPDPRGTAQAPASPSLAQGIQQVEEGALDTAVITLDDIVRRLSAQPGQEKDLTTAYLYLGMAQLGLNQIERARASVGRAAKVSPTVVMDPRRFPPRLIQMFDEAKREDAAPAAAAPAQSASPPPPFMPTSGSETKGGGAKVPLIVLGAAGVIGGVAVATSNKASPPSARPAAAVTPAPPATPAPPQLLIQTSFTLAQSTNRAFDFSTPSTGTLRITVNWGVTNTIMDTYLTTLTCIAAGSPSGVCTVFASLEGAKPKPSVLNTGVLGAGNYRVIVYLRFHAGSQAMESGTIEVVYTRQ